ncbi:MAG: S8 family serine peptidase, partial [Eubacterium aggregans]
MSANFTGEAYDSSDPMDDHSHGTHCTGIIGAQWNNLGVSGATTGTQIMAVKAADNLVAFQTSAIINGFSYIKAALKAGVQVKAINNSWGGSAGGQSVNMAITEVGKLSAISVFASGNKSINTDTQSSTCSTLKDNPYVVVVNATDKDGNAAYFTNYGDRSTDVAAPGVNIFSTVQTDKGTADARYVTLVLKDDYNRKKVNGTLNYASSENPSKVVEISIAKGQGKDGGGSNALSIKNRTNDG